MKPDATSALGRFATRHALSITFIAAALCLAGVLSALRMPSSVFPQTNFPRVVILVDNGIMPTDEMMATITRPIEEAMKDIPGAITVRSATKRGSAQINVFFNWHVDMSAVGTVCAGPAVANPRRFAGDRRDRGRARDVLGVSDHRHQPHQFEPRHHGFVGDGELPVEAALPANPRRGEGGNSRRPHAGISRRRGSAEIAGRRTRFAGRERRAGEEQPRRARRHDRGKLSPLPDDGGRARRIRRTTSATW